MATVITFASQKGGVGKTTSAVHLSTAFAIGGYRVLLIDLDPQGSIQSSIGIKEEIKKGTRQLYCQPHATLEDVTSSSGYEDLDVILSNLRRLTSEQEVLKIATDYHHLQRWIQTNAADEYDFIIIDPPATTGPLSLNALIASDIIIVPLQCESLAVKSLKRFLIAFHDLQKNIAPHLRIAGILLTQYDRNMPAHRLICKQVYASLGDAIFQSIIPQCPHILDASVVGKDVISRSLSSVGATGYIRLANEILDRFSLR